jgi:hypothetical protein
MGSGYQSLLRKRVYADPLAVITETPTYVYFIILIDMNGIIDGLNSMACKGNMYFLDEM